MKQHEHVLGVDWDVKKYLCPSPRLLFLCLPLKCWYSKGTYHNTWSGFIRSGEVVVQHPLFFLSVEWLFFKLDLEVVCIVWIWGAYCCSCLFHSQDFLQLLTVCGQYNLYWFFLSLSKLQSHKTKPLLDFSSRI